MMSRSSVLSQRYEELLSTQKFTDFSFNIDKKTIKCHKLILAAASPVFEAMCYGPVSEENSVDILDISPEVFLFLIKYIYVGYVDIKNESIQNLIELYYSAEKYMLPDLAEFCLNSIKSKLHFGNILPSYDLSVQMGLKPLIQVCSNFFNKCCMKNPQYGKALKMHYHHVSRDCLHSIIKNNKNSKYMIPFVMEWCQQQFKKPGRGEKECNEVLNKFDVPQIKLTEGSKIPKKIKKCYYTGCTYAERICYKACRPFLVSETSSHFNTTIKAGWYVQLTGIIINSRLIPPTPDKCWDEHYCECLSVEVWYKDEMIHRQKFIDEKVTFNCFLDIAFNVGIVLSPDEEYVIKITWSNKEYGAEYPLSIHSDRARAITFIDNDSFYYDDGSLLKGVKYVDLV